MSEAVGSDQTRGPRYFLLLALIFQESFWSPIEACYMKQNEPDASEHRKPENSLALRFLLSSEEGVSGSGDDWLRTLA